MCYKSNKNKQRDIVREYIKMHPSCTYREIRHATKIKVERIHKNMKEAYIDANIILPKHLMKRDKPSQKTAAINFIKHHPYCNLVEVQKFTRVNVARLFGSIKNAYALAGLKYHEKAITSGVICPSVIKRCREYERSVLHILGQIGQVQKRVRTTNGIADGILTYKNKTFVVEIKDFRGKNNITISQINQLITYMKALSCKNGLLICPEESFPKRKNGRNVYIGDLVIRIISDRDLWGRSIMDTTSVHPG